MSVKAVFLDRDNTLIEDQEYGVDPDRLIPLPGVVEGLRRLRNAGYQLVIITNQSGLARGIFTEEALNAFHAHMLAWFKEQGVSFDGLYYCPHYPEGEATEFVKACDCRKPLPGLLLKAAAEMDIRLSESWMVGDKPADVGAGQAAGCRTIRVLTGEGPAQGYPQPDFTAPDFISAVNFILNAD